MLISDYLGSNNYSYIYVGTGKNTVIIIGYTRLLQAALIESGC